MIVYIRVSSIKVIMRFSILVARTMLDPCSGMKFSMLGTGYCVDDPALRVTGQPGWYSADNGVDRLFTCSNMPSADRSCRRDMMEGSRAWPVIVWRR
jgi:hypothetical protein